MNHLRKTIMIVDDEPLTRTGLYKTLEAWSAGRFHVCSAENGIEALEKLNGNSVHLLITDIRMPEISGLDLVEAISGNPHKPVVIVISGHPEFDYAQTAIRLGVVNYLLKPLKKRKLIEAVERALEIEENRERMETMEKMVDTRLMHVKNDNLSTRTPVSEAMRYVDEHLQTPFGLRQVAEHIHLNPSYLSALFKEQTRLTFSEYVTRNRLQKAKELLIQTRLPIGDISEQVGYQTAKYFNKLFKEYEGKSPSHYRKDMTDSGSEI